MTVRDIVFYPDKRLREKCSPVVDFTSKEFLKLTQDMVDTLGHYKAIGLAAPQIGVNKCIFIINLDEKPQFFINPVIWVQDKGSITTKEGCLSFVNVFERIERAREVIIEATDVDGIDFKCILTGKDSVAAQHEFDHLNGKVLIDRVESTLDIVMENEFQRTIADLAESLLPLNPRNISP